MLLAVAVTVRLSTEGPPTVRIARLIATSVQIPGHPPALRWPSQGEAALEVQDVGSFGTSGAQRPVPIASVAKVMTAYLTLLEHPLAPGAPGFEMTISRADVREDARRVALGESTVAVRSGERLSERQALEALLIPSANNIAALLAAHDGATATFVTRMNTTARSLGMRSTTYTDPSGFNSGTLSTAVDQLKLVRFAMRERAFAEIVNQRSAELPVAGRVSNFNALVGHGGYIGVKTGSDVAAGGCLVFAKRVVLEGHALSILGVVLGQRGGSLVPAALRSARKLGNSATSALRVVTALARGTTVLSVAAADGNALSAVTAEPLRVVGWSGLTIPLRLIVPATVARPHAGQLLARLGAGDPRSSTVAVLATRSLEGPSLDWRLGHVLG